MAEITDSNDEPTWTPVFWVKFTGGKRNLLRPFEKDDRADFWRGPLPKDKNYKDIEERLRSEFGPLLKARVVASLSSEQRDLFEGDFEFKVLELRYGSLLALIGVDQIHAFTAAVASIGPEVLLPLILSCAEETFEEVTGVHRTASEVVPGVVLKSAMNAHQPAAAAVPQDKPTWGGVIVAMQRSFWLVPLLLALLVLWVAMTALEGHNTRLNERQAKVDEALLAIVEKSATRIDSVETLTVKLIEQLSKERESQAAENCACTVCCPAPAPCPKPPGKPPVVKPAPLCKR